MNLQELTDKAIKEGIEEFHCYVKEIGTEQAKKIILENTCLKQVKKYVENYQGGK